MSYIILQLRLYQNIMKRDLETVTVVVHPSGTDADNLTVADAMQQVLDTFKLLSRAEARDPTSNASVVWRLQKASTNSPFTVEATPLSSHPEIAIDRQAVQALIAFQDGMSAILQAKGKPAWIDDETEQILKRVLARNLNGVGRTDIFIGLEAPPTTIDHRAARRAENFLERIAAEEAAKVEDLTHKEYGSIEGHVTDATSWHGRPAFKIRARLSGKELVCVLPKEAAETVGKAHSWQEVFSKQRVLVSGVCHYNSSGLVTRIDAEEVQTIKARDISISELRDTDFTEGKSPSSHLGIVWGGKNG